MDVLSSQSNLAGYRAVVDCVAEFERPTMTAVYCAAAKVLVITGWQASRLSQLLKISASNRRKSSIKEQVYLR